MKTVVLLSTFDENAGDDLIRHGVEYLLGQMADGGWRPKNWTKSNALSASIELGPITNCTISRSNRIKRILMSRVERASMSKLNPWRYRKLLASDMIILCGTPLFYFSESRVFADYESWPQILLDVIRRKPTIQIVTLGGGSILSHQIDKMTTTHSKAIALIKEVVLAQKFYVCRDQLTIDLIRSSGVPSDFPLFVMPCPSIWARNRFGIKRSPQASTGRKVCISFSIESSDWATERNADARLRLELLKGILQQTKRLELEPTFLAHNDLDVAAFREAQRSVNEMTRHIVIRVDAKRLLEELSTAKGMITWRIHGAMAARSLNIPTFLFKTDSRFAMARDLGAVIAPNEINSQLSVYEYLADLALTTNHGSEQDIEQLKEKSISALKRQWNKYVVWND